MSAKVKSFNKLQVYVNPSDADVLEIIEEECLLLKTILDDLGNLY